MTLLRYRCINNGNSLFCGVSRVLFSDSVIVSLSFSDASYYHAFFSFCVLIHPFLQQPNKTKEKKVKQIFDFSILSKIMLLKIAAILIVRYFSFKKIHVFFLSPVFMFYVMSVSFFLSLHLVAAKNIKHNERL
jgi:hypothetical protein